MLNSGKRILFKLTGSISAFKACAVISRLVKEGHEVQTVASASALRFVGPATLEGLTGKPVAKDLWEEGRAMDHIQLMRWADLVIVAPASAHFINRAAQGLADDLLTSMFLAHDFKKPYLIAPAMNASMYEHPATQASLKRLRSWGLTILEPATGPLACGETGPGRLMEPEDLYKEIFQALTATSNNPESKTAAVSGDDPKATTTAPQVLVTLGGTVEPIDAVRSITNTSTGATGAAIAEALQEAGFEVTALVARNARVPAVSNFHEFTTFKDLQNLMERELRSGKYSALVHCAAVSDFHVVMPDEGKIPSGRMLSLELQPNPKLVNEVRTWAGEKLLLIAFKLTHKASESDRMAAVARLLEGAKADYVVSNDLSEIDPATNHHQFHIYQNKANVASDALDDNDSCAFKLRPFISGKSRNEMTSQIRNILESELTERRLP